MFCHCRGRRRSSQGRCRYERGRQQGSDLGRIHFDDLSLQRRQDVQELVLFGFPDLEVVQNRDDELMTLNGDEFTGLGSSPATGWGWENPVSIRAIQ